MHKDDYPDHTSARIENFAANFAFATSSISLVISSPNNSVVMGVDGLHNEAYWVLRLGHRNSRHAKLSSRLPDNARTRACVRVVLISLVNWPQS